MANGPLLTVVAIPPCSSICSSLLSVGWATRHFLSESILSCMPMMATCRGLMSSCVCTCVCVCVCVCEREREREGVCENVGLLLVAPANLLYIDDFAPFLHVWESVLGIEDGFAHTLLVDLSVSLSALRVGRVEHKPTCVRACVFVLCVCVCVWVGVGRLTDVEGSIEHRQPLLQFPPF